MGPNLNFEWLFLCADDGLLRPVLWAQPALHTSLTQQSLSRRSLKDKPTVPVAAKVSVLCGFALQLRIRQPGSQSQTLILSLGISSAGFPDPEASKRCFFSFPTGLFCADVHIVRNKYPVMVQ